MIKIIRHGDKKRLVCTECGCIFTYETEDTVTNRTGLNEYETHVDCPDCGTSILCDRL